MQPAGIAQCSSTIWSTSPFWRFGSITTVAASRGRGAASTLLRVVACEPTHFAFVGFLLLVDIRSGLGMLVVQFVLLSLICSLLFIHCLLLQDNVADFHQRIMRRSGFVDHIIEFDQSGKGIERGP